MILYSVNFCCSRRVPPESVKFGRVRPPPSPSLSLGRVARPRRPALDGGERPGLRCSSETGRGFFFVTRHPVFICSILSLLRSSLIRSLCFEPFYLKIRCIGKLIDQKMDVPGHRITTLSLSDMSPYLMRSACAHGPEPFRRPKPCHSLASKSMGNCQACSGGEVSPEGTFR